MHILSHTRPKLIPTTSIRSFFNTMVMSIWVLGGCCLWECNYVPVTCRSHVWCGVMWSDVAVYVKPCWAMSCMWHKLKSSRSMIFEVLGNLLCQGLTNKSTQCYTMEKQVSTVLGQKGQISNQIVPGSAQNLSIMKIESDPLIYE